MNPSDFYPDDETRIWLDAWIDSGAVSEDPPGPIYVPLDMNYPEDAFQ